ncbi:MAG: hypothetical protein ACXWLY_28265 [Thermoanaerobaculia bacterium]
MERDAAVDRIDRDDALHRVIEGQCGRSQRCRDTFDQDDRGYSRAPELEDLLSLCKALNAEGVRYVLIGGSRSSCTVLFAPQETLIF